MNKQMLLLTIVFPFVLLSAPKNPFKRDEAKKEEPKVEKPKDEPKIKISGPSRNGALTLYRKVYQDHSQTYKTMVTSSLVSSLIMLTSFQYEDSRELRDNDFVNLLWQGIGVSISAWWFKDNFTQFWVRTANTGFLYSLGRSIKQHFEEDDEF